MMKSIREVTAERLLVQFLKIEDYDNKPIEFLLGMVHAKTDAIITKERALELKKEVKEIIR